MKSLFKEYNIVLENLKLKEDMGIDALIFAKITVDVAQLVSFRESVNDNGDIENYTVVHTLSGHTFCLDIPYEEFQIMFHTEVVPLLNAESKNE